MENKDVKAIILPYSEVMNKLQKNGIEAVSKEFAGVTIMCAHDMPENEMLMFDNNRIAHDFIHLSQLHGYEHTKKRFSNLIRIKNLGGLS